MNASESDSHQVVVASRFSKLEMKNKCTLGNTPLLSGNFGTHLDFGLDNYDVVVGTFIPGATPVVNASFFEVEAAANGNIELQ
ncbi:hypothetical protein CMV_002739 [Castanea mollissima]|uniref:Uncharacterized protein n=1 Tax=Castanea mollissima TaxID=60419 RepID=A0A8J4VXA4_9ROSI|nr:hypothetical protein CMV_002739 [Castanea mollissima]